MQTAQIQASLRIRAVSPEPMLFAHISVEQGAKELDILQFKTKHFTYLPY